jgi:hypothetical protein
MKGRARQFPVVDPGPGKEHLIGRPLLGIDESVRRLFAALGEDAIVEVDHL